ncbi:ester cyclase [Arenibaculum pallidiluteum]|uniref:ester cyclase n=1 Tax=Arenibaculum pallidiluteum TaxID=2812559 RepID=UPI001A96C68E|nr:nuclear transport factor 2 family protein [Arenibaculum pallidiluteum]
MATNEEIIRELYAVAEGDRRDAEKFASLFHEDGYFQDESSGIRLHGRDVGQLIEAVSSAFPDMHRELLRIYTTGEAVIVELRLQGTHSGDFHTGEGVLPATGRRFDVPCCDVFRLRSGKVAAFHCYNQLSIWLKQLGALDNLGAAVKR